MTKKQEPAVKKSGWHWTASADALHSTRGERRALHGHGVAGMNTAFRARVHRLRRC